MKVFRKALINENNDLTAYFSDNHLYINDYETAGEVILNERQLDDLLCFISENRFNYEDNKQDNENSRIFAKIKSHLYKAICIINDESTNTKLNVIAADMMKIIEDIEKEERKIKD